VNVTVINRTGVRYGYRKPHATYRAYRELERYYGPYELFDKVSTYFRTSAELPSYIGKGVYNDIDYILQSMIDNFGQNANLSKSLFGGGKGNTFAKLYISTLGEMFERIVGAMSYYAHRDRFVFGSARELSDRYAVCGPNEISIFAPEQLADPDFLFSEFTEDARINWIPMRRLLTGEEVLVPAQLVFIYYPLETEGESRIGYATSGGLSLHDDRERALLHGITECIERDAINLRWYNRIPAAPIDLTELPGLSDYGRSVIAHSEKTGKRIEAYQHNIDLESYPVVTTVSFDDHMRKFSFCAGGGVGATLTEAVESSFREYGQSELNLRSLFYNPNWYSSRSMIDLFGFDEFSLEEMTLFYEIVPYYGLKRNRSKLEWYFAGAAKGKLSEAGAVVVDEFAHLLAVLEKEKIDPLVIDLTPPGFTSISLMKSFVPQLTFAFLPNRPCFGHSRFYRLAYERGLIDAPLRYEDLNPEPLPFP